MTMILIWRGFGLPFNTKFFSFGTSPVAVVSVWSPSLPISNRRPMRPIVTWISLFIHPPGTSNATYTILTKYVLNPHLGHPSLSCMATYLTSTNSQPLTITHIVYSVIYWVEVIQLWKCLWNPFSPLHPCSHASLEALPTNIELTLFGETGNKSKILSMANKALGSQALALVPCSILYSISASHSQTHHTHKCFLAFAHAALFFSSINSYFSFIGSSVICSVEPSLTFPRRLVTPSGSPQH